MRAWSILSVLSEEHHFPYPFVLVIGHCIFCSLFALVLLWCQPKMFPASGLKTVGEDNRVVHLSAAYLLSLISTNIVEILLVCNQQYGGFP